jgi:surface protein
MRQMFAENYSLEFLDLSNFDTSKVVDMSEMFMHDYALKTVYVGSKFSTGLVSSYSNMFNGVTSVK